MSMSCGVCGGVGNCPHHHHVNPAAVFPVHRHETPLLEYQFFGHGHGHAHSVGTWPPPADHHGRSPTTFHGLQHQTHVHPANLITFQMDAVGRTHMPLATPPTTVSAALIYSVEILLLHHRSICSRNCFFCYLDHLHASIAPRFVLIYASC